MNNMKQPLIKSYGEWRENLTDSVELGDYWFTGLDIIFALEWFINKSNLSDEQKNILMRAFPEFNIEDLK